ncbi:hypothetical protein QTN47_25760 [Danxiaibacter flavus]|uniref:Uncharacterized protein n=1 Tax=Danxiaibacter flavus TaxID=3049108 RepID=A0ABV3ZM39_9BACT|nr:hypothetical protein QNM32_25760 [Chitinophagaceae bacterium DXS]
MEPKMNLLGFEKSYSSQWFTRDKVKHFKLVYTLVPFDRFDMKSNKSGLTIESFIDIFNGPIEKEYLKITQRIGAKLHDLQTIGGYTADIKENPTDELKFRNNRLTIWSFAEDDASESSTLLIKYFEDVALPYYEKYANWLALDNILNNSINQVKSSIHCRIETERDLRGIILAKLINRPDLNDIIKVHYRRLISFNSSEYMIEYEKLLKLLPQIQPLFSSPKEAFEAL